MELKEVIENLISTPEKVLEQAPAVTLETLPKEDQQTLCDFFVALAEISTAVFKPGITPVEREAGLISWGFIIGHNWVKQYWTLW